MADADRAAQVDTLIAALPVTARLEGMRRAMPEFSQALLTFDADESGLRWMRIMLRSREQTAASIKSQLIDRVNTTVADFTQRPEWKVAIRFVIQCKSVARRSDWLSRDAQSTRFERA